MHISLIIYIVYHQGLRYLDKFLSLYKYKGCLQKELSLYISGQVNCHCVSVWAKVNKVCVCACMCVCEVEYQRQFLSWRGRTVSAQHYSNRTARLAVSDTHMRTHTHMQTHMHTHAYTHVNLPQHTASLLCLIGLACHYDMRSMKVSPALKQIYCSLLYLLNGKGQDLRVFLPRWYN